MANPSMQEQFIREAGEKPKRDRKAESLTRKRNLGRSKPIKPESDEHKKLKRRWALIKQSMIQAQLRTNGHTACMECGAVNPMPLDLDHIIPTGRGGEWWPTNAQLICRRCHDSKHGNQPVWSTP